MGSTAPGTRRIPATLRSRTAADRAGNREYAAKNKILPCDPTHLNENKQSSGICDLTNRPGDPTKMPGNPTLNPVNPTPKPDPKTENGERKTENPKSRPRDLVEWRMASAAAEFSFTLNGLPVRVSAELSQTSLLDFLRNRALTGSKEGCAEGECGACAVLLVTTNGQGQTCYQSANSCLIPLPAVADREVLTVEALKAENGHLAEVQTAMIAHNGSQCGYCTPGFVVSMFAEQYRVTNRPPDVHALSGNLCRCTGYRPIRDALLSLGPAPAGPFHERLAQPAPQLTPFDFDQPHGRYSRPQSLAECLGLAAENPEAQFVAGNTDLGVMTNLKGQRFTHLIGLEGIPELLEFHDTPDFVEIGAGLTLTAIGELWTDAPPVIAEWLPLFASPLIRNRATLGGNLATASPIGDSAPMLLALAAEVRIASLTGERTAKLHDFFLGYRKTQLAPGEILRSIRIPKPLPELVRFYKAAKRAMDDISTVAACFAITRDADNRITRARLAFGGVAAVPLRVPEAERQLESTLGTPADLTRAKQILAATLKPMSDHRGSADYRLALTQSLLDKFWSEL